MCILAVTTQSQFLMTGARQLYRSNIIAIGIFNDGGALPSASRRSLISTVSESAAEQCVVLRPGAVPSRIFTMKGLYLRSVLYSRYYYNLTCEASRVVEIGASSTQDKSRIVNTILPFTMKHCTEEDHAVLTSTKPDSASPEYDTWNSNLLKKTAEIESKLEIILEREESIYFPLRDTKKLRRKHMSVNGVEGRLGPVTLNLFVGAKG